MYVNGEDSIGKLKAMSAGGEFESQQEPVKGPAPSPDQDELSQVVVPELKAIRKRLDLLEAQGKAKAPKAKPRKEPVKTADYIRSQLQ